MYFIWNQLEGNVEQNQMAIRLDEVRYAYRVKPMHNYERQVFLVKFRDGSDIKLDLPSVSAERDKLVSEKYRDQDRKFIEELAKLNRQNT